MNLQDFYDAIIEYALNKYSGNFDYMDSYLENILQSNDVNVLKEFAISYGANYPKFSVNAEYVEHEEYGNKVFGTWNDDAEFANYLWNTYAWELRDEHGSISSVMAQHELCEANDVPFEDTPMATIMAELRS